MSSTLFLDVLSRRGSSTPLWYGISDRRLFPRLSLDQYVQVLLAGPADLVLLREKDLSQPELRTAVRTAVQATRPDGPIFLVSSNVEVALEEGADGVHLTSTQAPAEALRLREESGRTDFLVGKSAHSAEEAKAAAIEGVDYVFLSPIFAPLSKGSYLPPIGIEPLRQATREVPIPVFALGGIDQTNASEVIGTGVVGVAGISWLAARLGVASF